MLRPFLLVGVGGSGGKTLRVVHEELQRKLTARKWDGGLPRAWQFLHIDVPTFADGLDPDLPAPLPSGDYQGLVAPGLTYRTIDAALVVGSGRTPLADAIAGWRPEPDKVNVPVEKGAGQFRALGRMIAVAHLGSIADAVERARREMHGTEVTGELAQVSRQLGGEPAPSAPEPVVVVISSLAGGSGAGAVIDVCDTIRALGDSWASESMALLYAPDVFDYLPEEKRKGVRPNALATVCELLAAYWNNEGASEAAAALLGKHGVQLGAVDKVGPRYPFLIGARNAHVSFATQNDVYRAMGRSVAAWLASERLQDRIGTYTQGNWVATASSVPDALPLKPVWMETPFSALGSARVGLGRDRFAEYSAQRLARTVVDRLLRQHETDRLPGDDRNTAVLVRERAETAFGSFLENSRLNERGSEANDILDALRAEDHNARLAAATGQILTKIIEHVSDKGQRAGEWSSRILQQIRDRRDGFLDAAEQARRERGRLWVQSIQTHLGWLTAQSTARQGARVTIELLGKLALELTQVREELVGDAAKYRRWAADVAQYVQAEIEAADSEVLPPSNPQLREAVKRGVQALDWESEADLCDLVVELIPDLVDGLVRPLTDALNRSLLALEQQEKEPAELNPHGMATWPADRDVPRRLRPAANEFLVDSVEDYPRVLDTLLVRTTGLERVPEAWAVAQMLIALGAQDLTGNTQNLILQTTGWVPRRHDLQSGQMEAAGRAAFDVRMTAEDLLSRATQWASTADTPFDRYLGDTLRSYLDPAGCDPDEAARRLRSFEGKFIAACDAAAPLVNVNPRVLVQVHGRTEAATETLFTEIPFPPKSPGRAVIERVLQARGMWGPDVERSFTDSATASIDVFSLLREPYEPVVFDSLMKPIASEWAARGTTPDLRSEFWRWRRARPLPEFVPVAPEFRRAMVRGWFTSSLLNQLQLGRGTASVFVPNATGGPGVWLQFPNPLLTPNVAQDYDYLPAVLMSLPLAMLEANVEADLTGMKVYERLRDLGRSGGNGEYRDYARPTRELEQWILQGTVPEGAPSPDPAIAGRPDDDWEKRRQQVHDRLSRLAEKYDGLFADVDARQDPFDLPLVYELRDDVRAAFSDLRRALSHLQHDSTRDGTWN